MAETAKASQERPSESAAAPQRSAEELKKEHDTYKARKQEWGFFGASYAGGQRYITGGYLYKHPNETEDAFKHRLQVACYYNFCQEIVDLYVSYLLQKPAEIDYKNLAKDDLFEAFREDCDLKGNRLVSFLREAQRKASIYGHIAIVVDKPKLDPAVQTREDEREKNLRPYLYCVYPQNIVDWKYERVGTQGYRLTYIKILEQKDPARYRIWTEAGWELWEIKDDKPALLDYGSNSLGRIPVVMLYNLAGDEDMIGRSDLNDIAYINRHIFNLCSWNDENIENTCFAMLAKAKRRRVPGEENTGDSDQVGPTTIVEYDPELPNDKPFWLEPPGVSQEVFDKRLDRDIAEIHRIAKMGGVGATEVSERPKSGVALELEFRMMNSTLAEKADNIEEAHIAICNLYAAWMNQEFSGDISYPDDFNVEDLATDLENAINATAMRISSRFNTEMKRRIVRIALPKLDPAVRKEIEDQIEAQKDLFIPGEFGLLLQYNLSNPVDLVMALKGFKTEAEAKQFLERNKQLNEEYGNKVAAPNLGALLGKGDKEEKEEEE